MSNSAIKELFNEPSCSYSSDTSKKSTCERLIPGGALGGCSFEGALDVLRMFKRTAHIIHAPSTCSSVESLSLSSREQLFLSTTQIVLNDIIFGGEEKLALSLEYIYQTYHPHVMFIYLTCVSSLIGEDIESIARTKQAQLGTPVIVIPAAGFMGGIPFGARVAGVALFEHLMGQKEPSTVSMYDINLIGFNALECEMVHYKTILEHLGFSIRWVLGASADIETTYSAHCAKLNVLICAKPLVTLARKMEERWQIPWVDVSFYGTRATSDAIRAIVEVFADGLLTRISEHYICDEEQRLNQELIFYKRALTGKIALLNLRAKQSWQFIPLLKELRMRIAATSIEQSTQDDIEKVYAHLAGDGMVSRNSDEDFAEVIYQENVDILLCHYPHSHIAVETKIVFMTIDDLSEKNYSGYEGLLAFAKDIFTTLNNPLFKVVYTKAPWE